MGIRKVCVRHEMCGVRWERQENGRMMGRRCSKTVMLCCQLYCEDNLNRKILKTYE